MLLFEFSHENICVCLCAFSSHLSAFYFQIIFAVKFKVTYFTTSVRNVVVARIFIRYNGLFCCTFTDCFYESLFTVLVKNNCTSGDINILSEEMLLIVLSVFTISAVF